MTVNNYRITISPNTQQLNIPIQLDFDNLGKEQGFVEYEEYAINEVINPAQDFEVTRFPHSFWDENQTRTDINYNFYFFDNSIRLTATTSCDEWTNSYSGAGFNNDEVYYYANSFTNSFFKLDFYDNKSSENQKIYFTVIIPVQQGKTQTVDLSLTTVQNDIEIKKPEYQLDYIGDKEGFFIYWLKSRNYLNIDNFFMSCKFWNAKDGEFTRFVNRPQAEQVSNSFGANSLFNFYYLMVLDYPTQTYTMYDTITFERVGTASLPIRWYEYVGP